MPNVPQFVVAAVDFCNASARAVALAGLIADRCGAATFRLLRAQVDMRELCHAIDPIGCPVHLALQRRPRQLRRVRGRG